MEEEKKVSCQWHQVQNLKLEPGLPATSTRVVEMPFDSTRIYVLNVIRQAIHRKMRILPNSYLEKQIRVRVKLTNNLFFLITGENCLKFLFNTPAQLQTFPEALLVKTHKTQTRMKITYIQGKITEKNNACFTIRYRCCGMKFINIQKSINFE